MKKLFASIALMVMAAHSFACSTFLLSKNGQHVFGRNYDWVTGNGMMMVNARQVSKTSFMSGKNAISWVSAYGSITFNQFGKEFPHGGMNEKGLVVELMWLNETVYPAADNRAALNELQWIQYQLDNCATIEEVIANDSKIRIVPAGAAPLHFLIADASGKAATIEFIGGKMVAHQGKDLPYPVLTNTVYDDAVKERTSARDNSVQRFATACDMVQQFKTVDKPPVDYAFGILKKISQRGYTRWSIVYDITNRKVYCTTDEQPTRRYLSFNDFDFTCKSGTQALDLNAEQKQFAPLSFDQNKNLIETSARESGTRVNISNEAIAKAAGYFNEVTCK